MLYQCCISKQALLFSNYTVTMAPSTCLCLLCSYKGHTCSNRKVVSFDILIQAMCVQILSCFLTSFLPLVCLGYSIQLGYILSRLYTLFLTSTYTLTFNVSHLITFEKSWLLEKDYILHLLCFLYKYHGLQLFCSFFRLLLTVENIWILKK